MHSQEVQQAHMEACYSPWFAMHIAVGLEECGHVP